MVNFAIGYTGSVGVLTVNGAMTLQQIDKMKAALMKLISGSEHVVVNLEDVTDIDMACLQLLCAAHRTSTALNKNFTITGNRPEIFKNMVNEAGFPRKMGCVMDNADSCLWVERAK